MASSADRVVGSGPVQRGPLMTQEETIAFVRENTRLHPVPLAPEISLYVSDESAPIWSMPAAEVKKLNLPDPFWAQAWSGGQALARYVLDHPETVRGKRVLDLGSGGGLVAIAAAKSGARHVISCDVNPHAAAVAPLNAAANGVTLEVITQDILDGGGPEAEVFLAGDVFYFPEVAVRMTPFLESLHKAGIPVLIGDPARVNLPVDKLEMLAEYSASVTRQFEDPGITRTMVYRFI